MNIFNIVYSLFYSVSFECCSLLPANHQQVQTPAPQNPLFASDGETEKSKCSYLSLLIQVGLPHNLLWNESIHLLLLYPLTRSQESLELSKARVLANTLYFWDYKVHFFFRFLRKVKDFKCALLSEKYGIYHSTYITL